MFTDRQQEILDFIREQQSSARRDAIARGDSGALRLRQPERRD